MKKIVIDARIISTSTGRYIERLLTYLESIDTKNHYIILVRKKDLTYWVPRSKNFVVKIADYDNFSFNEQLGFALFLYKEKADLVHFCMPQQPILYFKPSVTTMHDLILLKTYNSDKNWLVYHIKQFIGRFVFWYVAHKSRYIITPSDFSRTEYLHRYHINAEKVVTTHLAADTPKVKPKKIHIPYKKYIMYVGQQSDYKNIRRLILAHQELLTQHPQLGLVLVGGINASARKNQQWVQRHNYKNIIFTGFVSDEELSWLYKNTQSYVFPSLMEGFGLPGLEAMLQGAPVVSSEATCLPEIYGSAAIYFDPESVDDIAKKIHTLLSNSSQKKTLIATGYRQVKKYSWNKTALQTFQIYQRALEGRK